MRVCVCVSAWAVSVSVCVRVHLWMYLAGSSAELIELFFLNSWELLGRGQMPLGTRCVFSVRLCVRVCQFACTLCVSHSRACVPAPPMAVARVCACACQRGKTCAVMYVAHGMRAVGLSVAHLVVSRHH